MGTCGNHYRAWLGQRLEAGGKVRRLADHGSFRAINPINTGISRAPNIDDGLGANNGIRNTYGQVILYCFFASLLIGNRRRSTKVGLRESRRFLI
jgi:hypothetical protein